MAFGNERCAGSRTADGAMVGSQPCELQSVRRPMWVIWIIVAQPWRWSPSAKDCSHGMTRSSPMSICPNGGGESIEMVEEPPNIESASPPLAFSSW